MFWVELILVLAIIFLGVRKGGTFLAMAGGVGMLIMTFFFHVTPADPPVTVILIMIAVIVAAATMQACGGLDFLVRIAEKILRRNPRMITVLAPVVAYIFTFMCGTGHIIYSLLPVINEISIETGVRPERPISASIIASQQAITACPISAATVGILAFMAEATNYKTVNIFTLLVVCIPATLIGTVACALAVMKKGKELAEDPEFQARVASGQVQTLVKNENAAEVKTTKEAKISVAVFLVAMVGMDNYEVQSVTGASFHKLSDQTDQGNAFGNWDPDKFCVEDSAFGFIRMKNGAVIELESAWALNTLEVDEAKTSLCGTKAGADMKDGLRINYIHHNTQVVEKPELSNGGVAFFSGKEKSAADYEQELFYHIVVDGAEQVVKPAQAAVVTRILEAVYRSAESGETIYFD